MRAHATIVACLVAAAAVTAGGRARATTCEAPVGAEARLREHDGRDRLRWIDQRLGQEASKGRFWARAWAIGIGAGGLGSLAPVPFVAPGDRIDWYTGAVSAAFGVIPFLVSPLAVTRDAPKLRAAVALVAWDDDARVCALLADAEHKLVTDARDERWQQGWWIHAGNIAFNTGVMLFLGLGYHHWTSGILNGASGAVVGETIILTQPTGAIEDLGAYNRGDLSMDGARADHASTYDRPWGWSYAATF